MVHNHRWSAPCAACHTVRFKDVGAVMGVLNVTPDSFSDGGLYLDHSAALKHGRRLIDEGATVVDVGGESTRPGADPVGADEELKRVLPVVEGLANEVRVSIDTRFKLTPGNKP